MTCTLRRLFTAVVLLLAVTPGTTFAKGGAAASCPSPKTHSLPHSASPSPTVFSIGVSGGSLRPWSADILLDGSVSGTGTTTVATIGDHTNTLKGLLALADANGFFNLSAQIGCSAGSPDVSGRYVIISTATGKKKVTAYGSCRAAFNQLFAVLSAAAGVGR